jgi:ferredoxin
MKSNFSVCLLTHGSGSEPDFLVSEVNLRPGHGFVPNSQDTILLASGFSSLYPDAGFPLSPTLQLNHDLGNCSDEFLQRIARAEIAKVQETTFRSYTVEQDSRVCVISSSSEKLNVFLDNYGGILDIEPILVMGYNQDLPTATELAIEKDASGYRLEYSVRSPVNTERCTYCGACGPACPESCLNENLFLDYSVCTFCKECEKACVNGAIDVYGAEQRSMRTPAIVILDGTEVALPADRSAIYTEKKLSAFLATQFSCQVDEVVTCDASTCQYSGQLGYGCQLCVDTCQYGAISKSSKGIQVDSLKCEECGGCVAVCPTGSMQYERFKDTTFTSYIASISITPGTTVVLGSEKALHKLWWSKPELNFDSVLFLEYNEIRALSLFHLLYLYASGAGRIVLLGLDDELQKMEPLQRQVALAGSLLNTYCQVTTPVVITTLSQFLGQTIEPIAYALSETLGELAPVNRRENLAIVLQFLTEQSGRQARIKANVQLPFATIFCDEERCTQCYACLNNCRVQSLGASEDKLGLESRSALCVGCGICVRVCPEHALQMIPGATLDDKYFSRLSLAQAEPMACKKCGKVFGSRKSFERVMAILAKKETVNTSHFEYCETCRVVNLFENE